MCIGKAEALLHIFLEPLLAFAGVAPYGQVLNTQAAGILVGDDVQAVRIAVEFFHQQLVHHALGKAGRHLSGAGADEIELKFLLCLLLFVESIPEFAAHFPAVYIHQVQQADLLVFIDVQLPRGIQKQGILIYRTDVVGARQGAFQVTHLPFQLGDLLVHRKLGVGVYGNIPLFLQKVELADEQFQLRFKTFDLFGRVEHGLILGTS